MGMINELGITVPVAIHLDHGSYEGALKCIEAGFSSVMFDGSHYPIEENIAKTTELVRICNEKGISIEAEVGAIGGHKISKKKKKQFKANLKKWVKENRNKDFKLFMSTLNRKLIGTNNYYSVSGAIAEVRSLYNHAFWVVLKWMNRRSQRKSFTLDSFNVIWKSWIKQPYIHVNIWGYGDVVYN